jgi:hypothetical protein
MLLSKRPLLARDAKCHIAGELLLPVQQITAGIGKVVPRIKTSANGESTTAGRSS